MTELLNSDLYTWVVLPILIAIARIMDVTVGTVRLIFVSRGYKYLAPVLGFFEVIIWLLAIGQIMQHLSNFMCYLGYGMGFALGNYIGIIIVEKMSLGTVLIRIVPKFDATELIQMLREANFGVTTLDAQGKDGNVKIVLSIVKRKNLNKAIEMVNQYNPNAFYTIEEIQKVNEGIFSAEKRKSLFGQVSNTNQLRK